MGSCVKIKFCINLASKLKLVLLELASVFLAPPPVSVYL